MQRNGPSIVIARESGQSSNHRCLEHTLSFDRTVTEYWMSRFRGA
jgi:hypothetical protein